jgi:hypothetical protein
MALGELPGVPGQQRVAQDLPGLELGVGSLAGTAELGVGPVGRLLRFWFARPRYGVRMCWPAPM